MKNIAGLRLHVDVSGANSLDNLAISADTAEGAERRLKETSKGTSQALREQDAATTQAAKGVAQLSAVTTQLARAEEAAQRRIKEVVRASLERQRAAQSAAAVTRDTARAAQSPGQFGGGGGDALAASFAESQRELEALNDAMANQAQSMEDIGERREWLTDLYDRGLLSFEDTESHLKTLEKQERALQSSIADHAREVENLVRQYDPAGAALKQIARDELTLQRALREGSISRAQFDKASAGLNAQRLRWQAEAQGVRELDKNLKGLSLTSATALRAYLSAGQAVARGDFGAAATQIGLLSARSGALAEVMGPLGIGIAAVATAVGAFTYATVRAQKETFEFSKAIAFSGNAAGVTTDQLRQMAEEMDAIGGTRTAAAAALTALAASGAVAGDRLQEFASIAERLRSTIGKPVEDTVRELVELGRSPVEASEKLQRQYGYLTAEIYEQIKSLEEQGRTQEAVNLAQRTFMDAQRERVGQAIKDVGYLAAAWSGVKKFIAEAGDALVDIGRENSLAKQIRDTEKAIAQIAAANPGNSAATEGLRKRLALLEQTRDTEGKAARDKAEADAKALIDENKKIDAAKRRREIEAASAEAAGRATEAQFGTGAASIQRQLSATLSEYSAYGATLDALRSADLLKEEQYYAEKAQLIERNRDARIKAAQDEIAAARREQEFIQAAAESAQNRQVGPDKEPERIRIRAEAEQKVLAIQDRIQDKEAEIVDIRRQSTAELQAQAITQVGAVQAILEQLRQETEEYELQASAGAHAADAIERLRAAKALERSGIPGAAGAANDAFDRRDAARDASIIAESERELQLLRMGNEERRIEEATRRLSANATTEQIRALAQNSRDQERADLFNAQFEAIRQEFEAFSEEYVLSYAQMYDEIDARVAEHTLTEENAAKARILIAKAESRSRRAAAHELFGGLSSLMASENRKLFNIGKAAAIANATLSAGEAIANAYATKPWYLGLALGISAAATLYAQISQLKNYQPTGFMRGGFTGNRPRDEIAGVVHGQEFVLNAAATSRIGARNLDALQSGAATVLPSRGLAANSSQFGVPNVTIIDQSTGKKDWDIEMMEGRMQIIARDAADRAVATQTPRLVSGEIADPNSSISKAIGRNVQAQRRRL